MPVGATVVTDVGHLLFGAALALSLAVLTRHRAASMRDAAWAQSAVVAATAAWQAWAAGSATLGVLALVVVVGGAGVLPWAFGREPDYEPAARPRPALAVSGAAALVVLAVLSVLPAHLLGVAPLRENLAFAVAALLIALLILASRAGGSQFVGLWPLANGVALAAILVDSPTAAAAVAGLYGVVAVGVAVGPADTA